MILKNFQKIIKSPKQRHKNHKFPEQITKNRKMS